MCEGRGVLGVWTPPPSLLAYDVGILTLRPKLDLPGPPPLPPFACRSKLDPTFFLNPASTPGHAEDVATTVAAPFYRKTFEKRRKIIGRPAQNLSGLGP